MADDVPARLDVVVLGASGFTGKYVVRELLECLSQSEHDLKGAIFTKIGVAGRNAAKLKACLAWALATCSHRPSGEALSKVELIEADARNADDIDRVCSRARVLVNCVGPYLEHGENIVSACVAAGVHYVDISGEAEFLEKMEMKYGERAVQTQTLVVSACGTISIVSDLGLLFHLRNWPLSAVPSYVDAYARFHSFTCSHATSAQTAFLALSHGDRLTALRRSAPKRSKLKIPGGAPADKGELIHRQEAVGVWATALPTCDRSVVRRTFWGLMHGNEKQLLGLPALSNNGSESEMSTASTRTLMELKWKPIRPVHYRVFFGAFHLKNAMLFALLTRLAARLAPSIWGQKLLQRFPAVFTAGRFTHRGPSEEEMQEMHFEASFVGRGFSSVQKSTEAGAEPDMEVVTRVQGPDPAYLATSISVVQCALQCLRSRASLPVGGVLTTATAFGGSNLQQCLEDRGFSFQHVSTRQLDAYELHPRSSSASACWTTKLVAHLCLESFWDLVGIYMILLFLLVAAGVVVYAFSWTAPLLRE